ncbi:MAG: hypothetical protein QNJ09_14540 [Paracoccaceae bacterium]|nr:hypothetical protein [Paracoccaceae bacterium]
MKKTPKIVLILGSGPNAVDAAQYPADAFDACVAINNAWRVRPDWSHLVFPEDFPSDRRPSQRRADQQMITAQAFIPAQNAYGGVIYAGGTMAFTAAYWALHALRPSVLAFLGCDMVYPDKGPTHFYGTGAPDPLRADITLQDLSAKSARLDILAARQGCRCVNLSTAESRLVFDRADIATLNGQRAEAPPSEVEADRLEAALGYSCQDGRYWERLEAYDPAALRRVDALWRRAHRSWQRARLDNVA